jgi:(2S)-methylsuccinyl-CoA dehydrogenase
MTSTTASLPTPDLQTAAAIIETARAMVGKGVRTLAATGGPDVQQVLAYDLAHAASAVETARSMLDYGAKGNAEGLLACAFTADASLVVKNCGASTQPISHMLTTSLQRFATQSF